MIRNRRLKFLPLFFLTQLLLFSFLAIYPSPVLAQSKSQLTEPLNFEPQVSIPNSEFGADEEVAVGKVNPDTGKMESDLLGRYMLAIINYALAAVAILATVVLMGGGLLWLTSRGDSGQVSKAKGLIGGSLTGMILLLCSWIILNTINPELTKFQSINTQVVDPTNYQVMTCCHPTQGKTRTRVQNKDGKKIAIEGPKKGEEVKCNTGEKECAQSEMCMQDITGAVSKNYEFHCFPDKVCCSCGPQGSKYAQCKNNITTDDCNSFCAGIIGDELVSYQAIYNGAYFQCDSDNLCSRKK